MFIVVLIMFIIQVLCLGFAFYCLKITKNNNIKEATKLFKRIMKVILGLTIVIFLIVTTLSVIAYINSILLVVVLADAVISLFFTMILISYGIKFLKNLEEDKIYISENSKYLLEVSRTFIYCFIVNGVTGIILAIVTNIANYPNFDYTITFSATYFLYLLLGVVFYVIHMLFERSIELYEENQLTI